MEVNALSTMLGCGAVKMSKTQRLVLRRSQSSDTCRKPGTLPTSHTCVSPQHLSAAATSPQLSTRSALASGEAGGTKQPSLPLSS